MDSYIKKIRHSKLPITLVSSDRLTPDFLKAISIQMDYKNWEYWVDEYGEKFSAQYISNLHVFEGLCIFWVLRDTL